MSGVVGFDDGSMDDGWGWGNMGSRKCHVYRVRAAHSLSTVLDVFVCVCLRVRSDSLVHL